MRTVETEHVQGVGYICQGDQVNTGCCVPASCCFLAALYLYADVRILCGIKTPQKQKHDTF